MKESLKNLEKMAATLNEELSQHSDNPNLHYKVTTQLKEATIDALRLKHKIEMIRANAWHAI